MLKLSILTLVCFTTILSCPTPVISKWELDKLRNMKKRFLRVQKATRVDAALLAAMASRESNTGLTLRNGYGDGGNAYGIMQIDRRFHRINRRRGPESFAHIIQAAKILKKMITGVTKKFPRWPRFYQIKGGIAAYNIGVDDIWTMGGIDRGTSHNNYSCDVLKRRAYLMKYAGYQSIVAFRSINVA